MKRLFFSTCCIFLFTLKVDAQTFSKEIAPIIYNKCGTCHRPGEIGPFSLTNYNEVSAYGASIKYVTQSKYMPPWKADPTYQHYLDENFLTNEQIKLISDWVEKGMPYGNSVEEPDFPDYPDGSALGTPDLVLKFSQKHVHRADNLDEYWYFVLPSGLTQNKKVKAIELRPGNKKIVHHALFFQDTTGKARAVDNKTPEYGFSADNPEFGTDATLNYVQYPGYVPGQKALRYPVSIAQPMKKNADLVIQMHYAPVSTLESDSSTVNIFFADDSEKIERYAVDKILLPFDLPGGFFSFFIPANQKKTFLGKWTVPKDMSFISIFPHMHLLGKRWKVWLQRPDGSTENLIKIDDWDFNWQGGYYFNRFIIAPKNSIVYAEAEYDNTTSNPNNPASPPKLVTWGEKTTDEMYYLPILHIPYKQGDENVVFDTPTSTIESESNKKQSLAISPNPAQSGFVNIAFDLPRAMSCNIEVFDANGRLVNSLRKSEYYQQGNNVVHLLADDLANGQYFVRLQAKDFLLIDNLSIVKSR